MKGSCFASIIMAIFVSMGMISFSTPVMAQDIMFPENMNVQGFIQYPAMTEWTTHHDTVGTGLTLVPDYEGSDYYELIPMIMGQLQWRNGRYASWIGNTISANLVASHTWQLGPLVRMRPQRHGVNNDRVDRMEDVDPAVELGIFSRYHYRKWNLLLEGSYDIGNGHDGFQCKMGGGYTTPLTNRNLMLSLEAYTTYADSNYMETYFGVDAADSARSGFSEYSADAGIKDVRMDVLVHYQPEKSKWGVMFGAIYKRLLGDAEDSPVVDDAGDPNQYMIGILGTYRVEM